MLQGKAKRKSISSTGDASSIQVAALPPRPGTAPAQAGPSLPGPEPGQLCLSPASKRALTGAGPSLVLDDVLEHPHEDEQACSSEESAAAAGSSTEPGTTLSSSPETTADAAGPSARPAAAQGAGPGKSASAAEQPADRHKEIRFEDPGASSSSSTHVSQAFASPFGSEASRPFAADVGPSSGKLRLDSHAILHVKLPAEMSRWVHLGREVRADKLGIAYFTPIPSDLRPVEVDVHAA